MTPIDQHLAIVNDFSWNNKTAKDYILRDRNLNDKGYYTTYILYQVYDDKDNFPIAELKILNPNQPKGVKTDLSRPFVSFISSLEWARTLKNNCSREKLLLLINLLNIKFSSSEYISMGVYNDSICRGFKSVNQWQAEQNAIKSLLL